MYAHTTLIFSSFLSYCVCFQFFAVRKGRFGKEVRHYVCMCGSKMCMDTLKPIMVIMMSVFLLSWAPRNRFHWHVFFIYSLTSALCYYYESQKKVICKKKSSSVLKCRMRQYLIEKLSCMRNAYLFVCINTHKRFFIYDKPFLPLTG
jgi:hypothetical protein